jgi:putative DNA primase/helicase
MLGETLEIGHDPSQHAAYIDSWIQVLEKDHREIFRAAADSEKILQFVLGLAQVQEQEQVQQSEASVRVQMPKPVEEVDASRSTAQERVYLAVPYAEKNQAKALGAQWDRTQKCWFAPPGTDLIPLDPWLLKSIPLPIQVEADPRQAFAVALAEAGLVMSGLPDMDGHLHRVKVQGDEHGQKSGAYVGFLDGHPAGFIQNFKTGEQINWKLETEAKALAVDRVRLTAEAAQKRQERTSALERQQLETAKLVEEHWNQALPCERHPYLESKGVEAYGLRLGPIGNLLLPPGDPNAQRWSQPGSLLIPIRDIDGKFWGAQSIDAVGQKSFPKGCRKQGGHFVIGEAESGDCLLFAEGYATAATLHELTSLPVLVTFDSGNLPVVAEAYRNKYPEKLLIIAGDDDHTKPPHKNVGRLKAHEAAESVGGYVLLPPFQKCDAGSDWNDFQKLYGATKTQQHLQTALQAIHLKLPAKTRANEKISQPTKQPERKLERDFSLKLQFTR